MAQQKKKPARRSAGLLEWYEAVVFATAVMIIGFSFVFRITRVQGSSMEPTLNEGDRLVVWAAGYTPQRGDIVILDSYISYGRPLVKRVIAMAGDTVYIDYATGAVMVNGEVLDEPYIKELTYLQGDVAFPLTVPEGKIFVMGDNRNGSKDSRNSAVGCIDTRDVLGRVLLRLVPVQEMGFVS